jgi:predicted transposase/invertase (TIGR01784 family)
LGVGEDYNLLNPVIALTITDFEMFANRTQVISRYCLKEKETLTDYTDDIELVFVELPKFNKTLEESETLTDKWLYFLKFANTLKDVPPPMATIPALKQAFTIARQSKLTKRELEALEKREIFIQDSQNAIRKAKLDGMQEKAIAIARELLDVLDIETISQKTGLSITEIQDLT